MNYKLNQERVKNIYQMLFEMATGNFTFRVENSANEDELDELTNLLNNFSEQLRPKIIEMGLIDPYYNYQSLIQRTFIINEDFTINSFSADLPIILRLTESELYKVNFEKLLVTQSQLHWETIKSEAIQNKQYHKTIQLLFLTADQKIIPTFCTISRLLYSNKIVISSVTTILHDDLTHGTNITNNATPKISDAAIIQNVYEYILNHLEEPLPSVKELSKIFGTNEFRIKDGFRHFFNTSVYQFYNEERLKKAHLLIQQSNLPLKEIAFMSGFNDYTNFYKAFKKRFSYSPSDISRNTN